MLGEGEPPPCVYQEDTFLQQLRVLRVAEKGSPGPLKKTPWFLNRISNLASQCRYKAIVSPRRGRRLALVAWRQDRVGKT